MTLIFGLLVGVLAVLSTRVAINELTEYKDARLPFSDVDREFSIGFAHFGAVILWMIAIGSIVAFFCVELPAYGTTAFALFAVILKVLGY